MARFRQCVIDAALRSGIPPEDLNDAIEETSLVTGIDIESATQTIRKVLTEINPDSPCCSTGFGIPTGFSGSDEIFTCSRCGSSFSISLSDKEHDNGHSDM
jgi:hypothetical protein